MKECFITSGARLLDNDMQIQLVRDFPIRLTSHVTFPLNITIMCLHCVYETHIQCAYLAHIYMYNVLIKHIKSPTLSALTIVHIHPDWQGSSSISLHHAPASCGLCPSLQNLQGIVLN